MPDRRRTLLTTVVGLAQTIVWLLAAKMLPKLLPLAYMEYREQGGKPASWAFRTWRSVSMICTA